MRILKKDNQFVYYTVNIVSSPRLQDNEGLMTTIFRRRGPEGDIKIGSSNTPG